MAKITPGVGFSEASGSVAGVTYLRTNTGLQMRNRIMTPQRGGAYQQSRKAAFTAITSSWRSLTEAQRKVWLRSEENGVSGFQLYVKRNLLLLAIGQTAVTAPGSLLAIPAPTLTSAGTSISSSQLFIAFGGTLPSGGYRALWATWARSAGTRFNRGIPERFLMTIGSAGSSNRWGTYANTWTTPTADVVGLVITLTAQFVGPQGQPGPKVNLDLTWQS